MNLGKLKELAGPLVPPLGRVWHMAQWSLRWVTTPAVVVVDVVKTQATGDVGPTRPVSGFPDAIGPAPDGHRLGVLITDRIDVRQPVVDGWMVIRLDARLTHDLDRVVAARLGQLRRTVRIASLRHTG